MKAVILHEYGGPGNLKLEDWPDPIAGPGEVLVRVSATSVNPVDYKMRSGAAKARFPVHFPGILGRDIAGIVRAVGEGVTEFAPGDHVFALGHQAYAELCVVPAADLAKVPEGLDLVRSGALPLVLLTGSQLVRLAAKVQSGQTVLVTGALGSVGRVAVYTARKAGAHVFAGVRKAQLEQAKELHAEEVIALDDKDALGKLGLIDAIADTVGGETAEGLLAKVRPGGIFGTVAEPPKNAAQHPTVTVTRIMAKPDRAELLELAEDVRDGKFTIPIDRMIPLEEAGEGQAAAEKGGIGKVLLLA